LAPASRSPRLRAPRLSFAPRRRSWQAPGSVRGHRPRKQL